MNIETTNGVTIKPLNRNDNEYQATGIWQYNNYTKVLLSLGGGEPWFSPEHGNGNYLALWKIRGGAPDQTDYTPEQGFPYLSVTRLSLLRVMNMDTTRYLADLYTKVTGRISTGRTKEELFRKAQLEETFCSPKGGGTQYLKAASHCNIIGGYPGGSTPGGGGQTHYANGDAANAYPNQKWLSARSLERSLLLLIRKDK